MRGLRRVSRLDVVSWGVLFAVLVIGARLFYLQVIRYPHYRAQQGRQVVSEQPVPARRGRILDRHGRTLAFDVVGYDVSVVKKRFRPTDLPPRRGARHRELACCARASRTAIAT
jgi:cell division protein FtsI/penicillin-binding protein 2